MALDKASLVSELTTVFEDVNAKTAAETAQQIADAIDTFVKTGSVTVASGIPVTTSIGVGTTTGPGTGTIS